MSEQYEMTLRDYLSVFRRRALHFGIVFALIFSAAAIYAILLPPTYRSTGTILVESQQIPTEIIRSTVTSYAGERIAVIKQRVLTRDNLRKIIDKYNLFEKESNLNRSDLMDIMRSSVLVDTIGAGGSTIAFKLSYDDENPETAYRVANELVTLFLDENVKTRTARASETTEFLDQEADKLRKQLEEYEGQIASYKQRHGNALPENMNLHMTMISRLEGELSDVNRELKVGENELRSLDIELSAARAGLLTPSDKEQAQETPKEKLSRFKKELQRVSATYKDSHPDVRYFKRQIEMLEKEVSEQAKTISPVQEEPISSLKELAIAKIELRISTLEEREKSLLRRKELLKTKISQSEKEVLRIPEVERGMIVLRRDYENAQRKYTEIREKQMGAQISENLEEEKKAERFSLIEPPLRPDKPFKPNRKKLMAMGFFLALAGSGGLVMLLESMNHRVRGPGALTALVGQPLLVSIPYITTREERAKRKAMPRIKLTIAALVILFISALAAVHFFYEPLDMLYYKFLGRFE